MEDETTVTTMIYSISTVYNQGGLYNAVKCINETFSTIAPKLKTIPNGVELLEKNLAMDIDNPNSPFKNELYKTPFNEYDCNYDLK